MSDILESFSSNSIYFSGDDGSIDFTLLDESVLISAEEKSSLGDYYAPGSVDLQVGKEQAVKLARKILEHFGEDQ